MFAALLTALAAGLLALGAAAGRLPFAAAVIFVQAVLAVGWYRLAPVPSRRGSLGLTLAAAAAADAALLAQGRAITVGPLATVLAFTLIATMIHEVLRRDGRAYVIASIAATTTGCTLVVLAAALLAERAAPGGRAVLITGMAAVAAAAVVSSIPMPPTVSVVAGTLAGLGAGGAVGRTFDELGLGRGLVLGIVAGLFAATAGYVVAAARSSRRAVLSAAVMLPIAFAAPAVYVLGRILVG
jgi:hypothetical protein